MPLSALFLLMMGAGGFLVYASVKGEHPWSMFSTKLGVAATAGNTGGGPTATPGPSGTGAVVVNQGTASTPGYPVKAQ